MNSTRTFTATYPQYLDDAVLYIATHQITATGYGAALQFQLDGKPATLQQVADVRALAESRGTFERISGPSLTPVQPSTIGKRAAQALHLDLARLGYTNPAHYEVCSAAVARELLSLTELTEAEVPVVWAHACLIRGYSTPVTRYYSKAVAA